MNYEVTKNRGKQCIGSQKTKKFAKKQKSKSERIEAKKTLYLFKKNVFLSSTYKTPRKGWID